MVPRLATLPVADRMSVIEADQALAVWPVQRERIVEAVRLFRRRRHPTDNESDPMAALWINDEDLPVEVEKHIEGRIARPCHTPWLSY